MVASVYGQPAVLVPQPDGGETPYLIRVVRAEMGEWAAWVVTSPGGNSYRVSEFPNDTCRCNCPAYRWNRHNAGRWYTVDGKPMCKHLGALLEQVIKPSQEPKG